MDTGNVRLIPTNKEVDQDKNIETLYQAPDSQFVKISKKESDDDVKSSAHDQGSDEGESVEVLEDMFAGASFFGRDED